MSVEPEHGLCLEIVLYAIAPVFPAVAGPLVSAERSIGVPLGVVDMHLTRLDRPNNSTATWL